MAGLLIFFLVLSSALYGPSSSVAVHRSDTLSEGSSLSVEKSSDVLVSRNGVYVAGFHQVGDNAYCFAIWINKSSTPTVIWMANRDQPVNGKRSKLSLLEKGNLVLTDVGGLVYWSVQNNLGSSSLQLQLQDRGNLVLSNSTRYVFWQSFDFPTDTLLPDQRLTKNTELISSKSQTNYSSGFYKLYFDADNILRLLFDSIEISSIYWPPPYVSSWDAGRSSFSDSRIGSRVAVFDRDGYFQSSDNVTAFSADFGVGAIRRLTVDFDGNLRLYSLDDATKTWVVTWQAISHPCKIHSICGANSLCSYDHSSGRKCSCLPGFKLKDTTNWHYGCEEEYYTPPSNQTTVGFIEIPHSEFYGSDYQIYSDSTHEECKNRCFELPQCKAYGFRYFDSASTHYCYIKSLLLNGYSSPDYPGSLYMKTKRSDIFFHEEKFELTCSKKDSQEIDRKYKTKHGDEVLNVLVWVVSGLGLVEAISICSVWWVYFRRNNKDIEAPEHGYLLVGIGFKRYSYAELKKASRRFSEEIGRGGGGIVYKGILSDGRIAAIKQLYEANQGEAEFLAEVSTLGKINHMNLIEMWGYCAEGMHRLLVYEYMANASLAENLSSNSLGFEQKYEIPIGTAKGLSYLHEECLEWVLHCDVKPQNILLDSEYKPKVADFGLSKLLSRAGDNDSGFSRIRGTRGYMAPEWVSNLGITSKVDVYSYGIVVLEMVTGKSQAVLVQRNNGGEVERWRLVAWVKEIMSRDAPIWANLEEIVDTENGEEYDMGKMRILVSTALQCVEDDMNARPTMRQVVERLMCYGN